MLANKRLKLVDSLAFILVVHTLDGGLVLEVLTCTQPQLNREPIAANFFETRVDCS